MITRRGLLEAAGGLFVMAGTGSLAAEPGDAGEALLSPLLPAGTRVEAVLDTLPGKKVAHQIDLPAAQLRGAARLLAHRQTPNDEFFVRYHLTDIPQVDAGTWKLNLGGEGANSVVAIGLDDLKRLPAFEVAAVCQCAGNRRGLIQPDAAGV